MIITNFRGIWALNSIQFPNTAFDKSDIIRPVELTTDATDIQQHQCTPNLASWQHTSHVHGWSRTLMLLTTIRQYISDKRYQNNALKCQSVSQQQVCSNVSQRIRQQTAHIVADSPLLMVSSSSNDQLRYDYINLCAVCLRNTFLLKEILLLRNAFTNSTTKLKKNELPSRNRQQKCGMLKEKNNQ